jgi:hypothetical protein
MIEACEAERGRAMGAIRGTYRNGQIILDGPPPADWKDGDTVWVEPNPVAGESVGIREEDWPTTPEGIAELLAKMDQVRPLELTEEEERELEAWRQKVKAYTTANMNRDIEELFR